ncbi:RmlC-like cupin [Dendrothele bispora CBS 962.96]|uniref:RmlC-like cupin n=1 Tax=Dendrothele bispora (strain CBS 962.96) TaxID=1314807 RepID=A0A4S8LXX7_DENBC|nr:RmlC-like cupin [Dendrothele bispora CBS 962.96]
MSDIQIVPRRSEERGNADHGWLKTFHTFSFAMYQESKHDRYGCLRVINEDRVAAHTGFGTHSHREFEIFSYVVDGELEHKDSMGNTEILPRGFVQLTSAGTGISHSEKAHGSKPVHFLQIWSLPSVPRLTPKYFTRSFTDEDKTDKWATVVAPVDAEGVKKDLRDGKGEVDGPAPVQSPLTLYASILSEGKRVTKEMKGTKGYFHVIMRSGYNEGKAEGATVKISGGGVGEEVALREGDGAYLQVKPGSEFVVENVGDKKTEVLLFDLA